jgi:hypothetical protein
MFRALRLNTLQIAKLYGMDEAEVYNRLHRAREADRRRREGNAAACRAYYERNKYAIKLRRSGFNPNTMLPASSPARADRQGCSSNSSQSSPAVFHSNRSSAPPHTGG